VLHVDFQDVNTVVIRLLCFLEAALIQTGALQGARSPLRPTGFSVYACPAIHFVRGAQSSAAGPTLDTGGWLALTRPGLSPGKRRRALLGVITPCSAEPVERERNRLRPELLARQSSS
jgi:hypothetical protein